MIANDFLSDGRKRTVKRSSSGHLTGIGLSKIGRCVAIYLAADLLKSFHVIQLLFLLHLLSAPVLVLIQKPFTSDRPVNRKQIVSIAQHAAATCAVHTLWLYGITLCGPFRSILLFEHSPAVVTSCLAVFFSSKGSTGKTRGAIVFVLAFVACLLLDRDVRHSHEHSEAHSHHAGLNHVFYHVIQWFGLPDHKGGVFILLLALVLNALLEPFSRRKAAEVGGSKRLHAISSLFSLAILTPGLLWTMFVQSLPPDTSVVSLLLPVGCIAALIYVIDFYVDTTCASKVDAMVHHRVAGVSALLAALTLSFVWPTAPPNVLFHSSTPGLDPLPSIPDGEHGISAGVIIAMIFFAWSTFSLTAPMTQKSHTGQFIGYSESGLPLYIYGEDFLQRTSHSISAFAKNTLKQVLSKSDSRKIFYFLVINLIFTFVEFAYGVWTNSLGLISDAFHMLFDCSALVMGLVASVMSTWQPSRVFSYGYGRGETLSGFINALFLLVIAFFIFTTALGRIFDPPTVLTEKLLGVSVIGLLVNLVGMFALHDSHGHSHGGGGHGHSHGGGGGSHGHAHNGADHGHSHAPKPSSHGHSHANANMQGVFLHVMADTLGSVFVIISTLLIKQFGWYVTDPLCSLILAVLIFLSVLPLIRQSAQVLLQRTPDEMDDNLGHVLDQILQLEGVQSYSRAHLWEQKSETLIFTLHVQVNYDAHQQKITQQILGILKTAGIKKATVQVEKEAFFQNITSLLPAYRIPQRVQKQQTLMVNSM